MKYQRIKKNNITKKLIFYFLRSTIKISVAGMSLFETQITSQGRDSTSLDDRVGNMGETPMLTALERGVGNAPGTVGCISGYSSIVSLSAPTLKTTTTIKLSKQPFDRKNARTLDATLFFKFPNHEDKIEQRESPCAFIAYHWIKLAEKNCYSMTTLRKTPCLIVSLICEFLTSETVEGDNFMVTIGRELREAEYDTRQREKQRLEIEEDAAIQLHHLSIENLENVLENDDLLELEYFGFDNLKYIRYETRSIKQERRLALQKLNSRDPGLTRDERNFVNGSSTLLQFVKQYDVDEDELGYYAL
jgi:hypothetical protein